MDKLDKYINISLKKAFSFPEVCLLSFDNDKKILYLKT